MYYITRRALRVGFLKVGGMNGQIVNAALPLLHLRGGNQREDKSEKQASFVLLSSRLSLPLEKVGGGSG